MSGLRKSLKLVTVGGSLCMVYLAAVQSPVFLAYVRDIGGTEVHIGLISGLPMIMLLWQFAGALLANRMHRRKPAFLVLIIAGRLIYLPIALLPMLMGGGRHTVDLVVLLVALSAALANVIGPAWHSWMADLIPKSILNRYWAGRYRVLELTGLAAYLIIGLFAQASAMDTRTMFLLLAGIGVTAGVLDILLFIWVKEPPNHIVKGEGILRILTDPFKHHNFRTLVLFQCAWGFTTMFAAAFMQLYAMEGLGLGRGKTTLLWCVMIMNALTAPYWGRMADKHGHRSIIAICTAMKPLILPFFIFATPGTALLVLGVGMFLDSIWNAGMFVAANGYMLKISPRRNRSVFVASITGLSGLSGGLGAICGGAFLTHFADFHLELMSRDWNNYHLLFAVNCLMRIACIFLAYRIREPNSTDHDVLLNEMRLYWPMRYLLIPVGFYRLHVLPVLKDTAGAVIRAARKNGKEGSE